MAKEENTPYYGKSDPIGEFLREKRHRAVRPHIRGRLIDLACGDNWLCREYEGEAFGVDFMNYGNADLIVDDYSKLPFPEQHADTVTILASLNYLTDPVAVLRECSRIMKDDGHLILTMPNASIMKLWHKVREPWARRSGFSKAEIAAMADAGGFEIARIESFLAGLNYVYVLRKRNK